MSFIKNTTTYPQFVDISELNWQISEMEHHLKMFENSLKMAYEHIKKYKQHADEIAKLKELI